MPPAASSPSHADATPLSAADLAVQPVSGHLLRIRRRSGDRWVAHWRDAAGARHKRVLGRAWTGKGRPPDGYFTKRLAPGKRSTICSQTPAAAS